MSLPEDVPQGTRLDENVPQPLRAMLGSEHLSLLCKLQQDREHRPCSGTCDGHGSGKWCGLPCECDCHGAKVGAGR